MAQGRFDLLLFADYSGAREESAQRRAIALWRQESSGPARKVKEPFTRESLREHLLGELRSETRRSRRVLFGIDHQWSWPRDLWAACGLGGLPWRSALKHLVTGEGARPPLGPPHVFPAAFNAFLGANVFYCPVASLARRYGLPLASDWSGEKRRLTERATPGAKPATRLGGTGAVAGQTLHGLRELQKLLWDAARAGIPVRAWPFDLLADDGQSHIGVEVYPTFCRPASVPKSDDSDARSCCTWAARADLARVLDLSRAHSAVRRAALLEGWILGAPTSAGASSLPAAPEGSPGRGRRRQSARGPRP